MRVLIVEDHLESREFLERLLQRWGLQVATADGLATGVAALQGTVFDAVLSDISLPDGSGYALIHEAKSKNGNLLGIALSGYSSAEDVRISEMAGFDHHLTKPFDCEQIRQLLGVHRSEAASETA